MAESSTKKRTTKKADINDVAKTAQTIATSKAKEIKDFVTDKAEHLAEDVKKYSKEGSKKVADAVKKKPLKALGIAALAGAVLGLFCRRKK